MILTKEPKGDTKEAIKLSKFFSNKDNIVYPIQSDLQRRYCWPSSYIDKFFKDYIINLYEKNKEADVNSEDELYGIIGDAILTKVEDNYGPEGKCRKQEIIDMSQRITTIMSFIAVILYLHAKNNDITSEEERTKLYDSYLKTRNGLSYKIISTFNDSDIERVINDFIADKFKTDKKTIKSLITCFNEKASKKNEVIYKPFESICAYVYNLIENEIGIDNKTIKDRLDLLLNNTYIRVEECEKDSRVEKFREVNTYRLGIANKDIYKSLLCSKGEKIDSKFQDFEKKIEMITAPKRINILKTPITVTEYIMKMGLILLDDTRESCKYTFTLEDEKNGIYYHLRNGLLSTEEKVLHYLDACINICDFLINSMNYKQDGFNEEWYLITENHNKPFIWLYNILPAYAISILNDEDKKSFAFEMVLKSYTVYSIKYSTNRSVQYIQPYMYSLAKEILEKGSERYCLEDFKTSIKHVYYQTFEDFINRELTKTVKRLDYSQASCKSSIIAIFSCFEYLAQKSCGKKRDNLFKLSNGKKEIDIDHILPKNKENENNNRIIDSIGNLTLLEKSLNCSKQDDEDCTFDRYTDSSFITTKLMIEGNRYEGLTSAEIEYITKNIIPYCTNKEAIDNFEDRIDCRSNEIAIKIKDFLK